MWLDEGKSVGARTECCTAVRDCLLLKRDLNVGQTVPIVDDDDPFTHIPSQETPTDPKRL